MSDFIRDFRSQMRRDTAATVSSPAATVEVQKPKFEDTPAGKTVGFVMLGVIGWLIYSTINPNPEETARRAAEKAEERQNGFHCLSPWDGSHNGFVEFTRKNLRDPSSFEHVRTRIGQHTNGAHSLKMEFRARNGFGGVNVGTALGSIRNSDCELIEAVIASS